jgi:hypothetical protein
MSTSTAGPRSEPTPALTLAKRRARILGLVVFLAVFLPLRLWRAGIENSLWIDETASFVLASQPAAVILDRCAVDTNPPGYFFALKAWLKLGRLFFPQPGILFARALGTVAWLLFAAGVWLLARSLAAGFAALLVTAVTGSACAAVSANDARGYCFATVGLCLAFLLMVDLYAHPTRPRWAAAVRWLVFALAASVALWTHLLSAPVFLLLCLLFAVLAWRRRTLEFAGFGALAVALAALSFLPWLLKVLAGIGSLEASAVTWMTPATVPNLVAVFSYWYPFGRIGGPDNPWLDALGAATIILPLAVSPAAARARRGEPNPMLPILAAGGGAIAIAFVCFLWLLQRCGVMTVFYAPRYPALTAAFWATGLAALAAATAERARWQRPAAWLLLAPWLVCSFTGQVWAIAAERRGGLREMRAHFSAYLPAPGADLYVMPSELLPFFRATFEDFHLRPIEALPCDLPRLSTATVLDLNFWHVLDRPRDLIARRILEAGALSAGRESASYPDWRRDYALYRLSGIDHAAGEALCRRGLDPSPVPIPPGAEAVALPENQQYQRGWSFPEVGPDLAIRRWASRETSEILFDRPLPAGAYRLHLRGYNPAYPALPAVIAVSVPGENGALRRELPEGEFEADLPFDLHARHDPFVLRWARKTWSPRTATGAKDARTLAALLAYAWVERRRGG